MGKPGSEGEVNLDRRRRLDHPGIERRIPERDRRGGFTRRRGWIVGPERPIGQSKEGLPDDAEDRGSEGLPAREGAQ